MASYNSFILKRNLYKSLNPYCSGQWPRTDSIHTSEFAITKVLILIVVDNGLVPKGRRVAWNTTRKS